VTKVIVRVLIVVAAFVIAHRVRELQELFG
jgi:hypothetical protein